MNAEEIQAAGPRRRTLVLGYGNVDRGDDGLGYHLINALAHQFGHEDIEPYNDWPDSLTDHLDVLFQRQLMPELAEILAEYDLVVFVDAHTGTFDEELRLVEVQPGYMPSAFTHHLTPEALLALTEVMFGRPPRAYLCSARGYEFDFNNHLSERTRYLTEELLAKVLDLIGR